MLSDFGLGTGYLTKAKLTKLQTHCERSGQSKQCGSGVENLGERSALMRSSPGSVLEQREVYGTVSRSASPHCHCVEGKLKGDKTCRKSLVCLQLLALKPTVSESVV